MGLGTQFEQSENAGPAAAHSLSRLHFAEASEILTADASAENLAWLKARFAGRAIRFCDAATLHAKILARFDGPLLAEAVYGLQARDPALSARTVVTPGQICIGVVLPVSLAVALALAPLTSLRAIIAVLSLAFVASGLFRALLAFVGGAKPKWPASPASCDAGLPTYTILVPLYHEARVLPALLRSLEGLDYPRALLDIKLVLEADDAQTIAAARAMEPGLFEIVIVPPFGPRTKPKAANYALAFARGEYLVVYDAEDRPEPDQLRKAVATFRAAPRRTACLQARLNFYNANHNWLTRMFALDYALWFDMLLPGLDRLGVPMPLGGTSNHFRTQVLRDIGGWDPFNVTEDADIGIRLSQCGFSVSMIDSTTFEEAPVALGAWLRQRSRWLKGYMQTWLVHMRDPARLLRRAGLKGFLAFQLFIGGGVIFALVNPFLWGAFILAWLFHWHLWDGVSFGTAPAASLLANNLILTYLAMIGPRRRGWDDLSPYGLTVILYWALVSVAGYRGLVQLVTKPFFWEKTTHGVTPA